MRVCNTHHRRSRQQGSIIGRGGNKRGEDRVSCEFNFLCYRTQRFSQRIAVTVNSDVLCLSPLLHCTLPPPSINSSTYLPIPTYQYRFAVQAHGTWYRYQPTTRRWNKVASILVHKKISDDSPHNTTINNN